MGIFSFDGARSLGIVLIHICIDEKSLNHDMPDFI